MKVSSKNKINSRLIFGYLFQIFVYFDSFQFFLFQFHRDVSFHSWLVIHCKITRYSLQKFIFIRCRSCPLQKITRYSLQNTLDTPCRSCSLQKITLYLLQNSLVARCRSAVTFKKGLQHRCFPVNFCEILRTRILQIICEWLLLKIISKC